MGVCCHAEEYAGSGGGDNDPNAPKPHKILFLGSGGCGKSTLLKQLQKLYGTGFTNGDRKEAIGGIASFVIETMRGLLEEYYLRNNNEEFKDEETNKAAKYIMAQKEYNKKTRLNEEISNHIKILWAQDEIKQLFDETAKLHLNGPCAHFFDSMDRISDPSFMPTDKDILLQRRPTTGLIEQFIHKTVDVEDGDNIKFQMVDVGGQKNERRKWIHQFENVAAIIYVVSLSAFDEPLYEDETINSLKDSIDLFTNTINNDNHWFKQSSLFLIFNKKDLFEQKIVNKSLKECFNDDSYDEKQYFHDLEDGQKKIRNLDFIKQQFTNKIEESKQVLTFETCAYEVDQVQTTFTTILKNVVLKSKAIPP